MRIASIIIVSIILITFCKVNQQNTVQLKPDSMAMLNSMSDEYFIADFNLFSISNNRFTGEDTLIVKVHPNGKIKSNGSYARNKSGEITPLKFGTFNLYNEDGLLIEQGAYDIGRYTQCCVGGACSQFYNYKYGEWRYFFSNGNKRAEVNYQIDSFHLNTSCEGGDKVSFGKVNLDESKFWSKKGVDIEPSKEIIKEFETVNSKQGKFHGESMTIDGDQVTLKFIYEEKQ